MSFSNGDWMLTFCLYWFSVSMESPDLSAERFTGESEGHSEQCAEWNVSPLRDLWGKAEASSVSYAPSIAVTDYSEFLPTPTETDKVTLTDGYNANAVLNSAWISLKAPEVQMPWDGDFWDKFLDPTVSVFEQLTRGVKRPMPFPEVSAATSSDDTEVERRIAVKPFPVVKNFLKNIRDVTERSWQEEREALWEMAIRRWVAVLDSWKPDDNLLLVALQKQDSFTAKAQIMVDVFFNKAPQTLIKRVNSICKLCSTMAEMGTGFPCTEEEFYQFLKRESQQGAPAARLKAYFEAAVFVRHVLGIESLQKLIDSRRCLGAVSQKCMSCPRQASPFAVLQLKRFHEVLREGDELWDRAMAGMILFCTYGRSRWSDAQHAEELIEDRDSQGLLCYLEAKTSVHKTARAMHLRHMFLPVSAPVVGVTEDTWGSQWVNVRQQLQICDLNKFPLMPAPDAATEPTKRPVSTQEAKLWILHLLGTDLAGSARLTSHSCKSTCLSYMAKRGAAFEDRLILGYHCNKLRVGLTYSRDGAARPLALLAHVLMEIRTGIFEPDNTRGGRVRADATPLDRVQFFADSLNVSAEEQQSGPEQKASAVSSHVDEKSLNQAVEMPEPPVEATDMEGHVTTDSSDDSDGQQAWAPVVGHYTITVPESKRLWLNHNSKMFHLGEAEHVRVLLCGRRIGSNFKEHEGVVRYDSAKCRQCFRLINS